MKSLVLLIWIFFLAGNNHNEVVTEFHRLDSRDKEIEFVNNFKEGDATEKAYAISIEMKQAEYYISPLKKIKIFNTGKKQLENLIKKYPNNLHMRYLRLCIQEKVPKILGYYQNIEEDKKFIQHYLNIKDETDFLDYYIKKNTSL